MTTTLDIKMPRGDSKIQPVQLLDQLKQPLSLVNAFAILTVKEDKDDTNARALITKTSRDPNEIAFTDPSLGRLAFQLLKADTWKLDPGCYPYDLELSRRGVELAAAEVGTIALTPGADIIAGTGTAMMLLHVGDLIAIPASINAANRFPTRVMEIIDDTHVRGDYKGWISEVGLAFQAFLGDVKTVVRGNLILEADTTR